MTGDTNHRTMSKPEPRRLLRQLHSSKLKTSIHAKTKRGDLAARPPSPPPLTGLPSAGTPPWDERHRRGSCQPANQPTKTQRTQVDLKRRLCPAANLEFPLGPDSVGTQSSKRQDGSRLTDFWEQPQDPDTLGTVESGEPNSHEFLIFRGPDAHVGIYDCWLPDRLTANILFPLFVSKCAINLETTASGRRVKTSHRSCVIISVIVSCCC